MIIVEKMRRELISYRLIQINYNKFLIGRKQDLGQLTIYLQVYTSDSRFQKNLSPHVAQILDPDPHLCQCPTCIKTTNRDAYRKQVEIITTDEREKIRQEEREALKDPNNALHRDIAEKERAKLLQDQDFLDGVEQCMRTLLLEFNSDFRKHLEQEERAKSLQDQDSFNRIEQRLRTMLLESDSDLRKEILQQKRRKLCDDQQFRSVIAQEERNRLLRDDMLRKQIFTEELHKKQNAVLENEEKWTVYLERNAEAAKDHYNGLEQRLGLSRPLYPIDWRKGFIIGERDDHWDPLDCDRAGFFPDTSPEMQTKFLRETSDFLRRPKSDSDPKFDPEVEKEMAEWTKKSHDDTLLSIQQAGLVPSYWESVLPIVPLEDGIQQWLANYREDVFRDGYGFGNENEWS